MKRNSIKLNNELEDYSKNSVKLLLNIIFENKVRRTKTILWLGAVIN